jgi:hypothetical protein
MIYKTVKAQLIPLFIASIAAALLIVSIPAFAVAWEDDTGPVSRTSNTVSESSCDTSIYGVYPAKKDDSTFLFERGWIGDATGEKFLFPKAVSVSINAIGLNGVDSEESTHSDELYPYVIVDKSSQNAGIVLSSQISMSYVHAPANYHVVRKLPWGVTLQQGSIPAFHFSGWGSPFTRYTDAGTNGKWAAIEDFQEHRFVPVSLAQFIPDNARLAYILIRVVSTGKSEGSGFVRVLGEQGEGIKIGDVSNGQSIIMPLFQRVNSKRELFIRTLGAARMDIWVLGYVNTEPS